jgi:hypothetical protein
MVGSFASLKPPNTACTGQVRGFALTFGESVSTADSAFGGFIRKIQPAHHTSQASTQSQRQGEGSDFMETITYSQVQELVTRLPAKNLPIAYRLLVDLSATDTDSPSLQRDFMRWPIAERRRLMAEQAQQMVVHYEETALERQTWQAGDFFEY